MTSQYRHRRTSNPATPTPTLEPGEIAVNTANRQISLGDAASATLGVPKPLLAIRFFDIAAIYAIGDIVTNAGQIWRAIAINGPGAFNAAQWEPAASQVTIASNPPSNAVAGSMWWDSDNGMLYVRYNDGDSSQWVQATAMPVVDTSSFVLKAGDTMTGDLLVSKADASILLKTPNNTTQPQIQFYHGALQRWTLFTTASAPNNLSVARYNDAGAFVDSPFSLDRNDGRAYITLDPIAPFGVATKQYVDARAGDAMAYSGMQINGGMEVSQELGTAGTQTNGKYALDGFALFFTGTAVVTCSQIATVTLMPGFSNWLQVSVPTAQAAMTAADYYFVQQNIEGYRIARLGWGTASQKPITLAFWTCHHRPGVYGGAIRNAGFDRCYAFTYTQNAADIPEYKTITIPGDPGLWGAANGVGMRIAFTVACGTTGIAPSTGSWVAGSYFTGAGQVNGVAATSDVFRLTGVTILPGTQAPTAAQSPLLMRPFDQELATCQRYYYKRNYPAVQTFITTIAAFTPSAASGGLFSLPTTMRAVPTVATASLVSMYNSVGAPFDLSSGGYQATTDMVSANAFASGAVLRAGDAVIIGSGATANNFHAMDARL